MVYDNTWACTSKPRVSDIGNSSSSSYKKNYDVDSAYQLNCRFVMPASIMTRRNIEVKLLEKKYRSKKNCLGMKNYDG